MARFADRIVGIEVFCFLVWRPAGTRWFSFEVARIGGAVADCFIASEFCALIII